MRFGDHSDLELDDIDLRILGLLQEDCRTSLVRIGEQVGLSAPAVLERIKKLEAARARAARPPSRRARARAARQARAAERRAPRARGESVVCTTPGPAGSSIRGRSATRAASASSST